MRGAVELNPRPRRLALQLRRQLLAEGSVLTWREDLQETKHTWGWYIRNQLKVKQFYSEYKGSQYPAPTQVLSGAYSQVHKTQQRVYIYFY